MAGLADYILLLLSQFAGGPGCIENNLMRFGLPAVMWGGLLAVAWRRQRNGERPREQLLVWGFALGLLRELFMFSFVSLQIIGVVQRQSAYFLSPPLEQALTMAAIVVIAGSFLRYILDDAPLARRYLQIGLAATVLTYLATFWWWAGYSRANPAARFGATWPAWVFHSVSALLIVGAMVILYHNKGWLRNVMMLALSFFLASDLLMLLNLLTDEVHTRVLCPVSHAFYILAIPMLGYIYIREQSVEREQALAALRDSERHFRDIVHNSQAGYFFINQAGEFVDVNEAWLHMHGYKTASEVRGRPYAITQPPQAAAQTTLDIVELLQEAAVPAAEVVHCTRDGDLRYHTASINQVVKAGRVTGLEGFLIDRTNSVRAEALARRRKEQVAVLQAITTLISEAPELTQILDSILEGALAVTHLQAGRLYLYDDAGALAQVAAYGSLPASAWQAALAGNGADPLAQVTQSGQPLQVTLSGGQPALDCCPTCVALFAGLPIMAREQVQGVLAGLGCSSGDMQQDMQLLTAVAQQIGVAVEKAQLAEEAARVKLLQELDRLRSELIANVSHDLRTPLGLIKLAGTSLLSDELVFAEPVRQEMLGVIVEETERLETIVDDLLLLSHAESGQLTLTRHMTPLAALLETAVVGMDTAAQEHEVLIEVDPPGLALVLDADRMAQVVRNLLGNAIKYSPGGGRIRVTATDEADQVLLSVTDEGIGIPEKEQERIFDRFYRLDNPITRQVRGAGLGLSVCREMVQAHGGRIWVESRPGEGSTFFIALPRSGLPEEAAVPAAALAN